ncbi:hypothetical protein RQP46_007082 [Phenoliferia psychrophenolica]
MPSVQVRGHSLSLSFPSSAFLSKKNETLRRAASSSIRTLKRVASKTFDSAPSPSSPPHNSKSPHKRRLQLSRRISYPILSISSDDPTSPTWSEWGIRTRGSSDSRRHDWTEQERLSEESLVDPFVDQASQSNHSHSRSHSQRRSPLPNSRFSMSLSTLGDVNYGSGSSDLKPSHSLASSFRSKQSHSYPNTHSLRAQYRASSSPQKDSEQQPPTLTLVQSDPSPTYESALSSPAPSYFSAFTTPNTPTLSLADSLSSSSSSASPPEPPTTRLPSKYTTPLLNTPPCPGPRPSYPWLLLWARDSPADDATTVGGGKTSSVRSFATSSRNWWGGEEDAKSLGGEDEVFGRRKGWSSLTGYVRRSV